MQVFSKRQSVLLSDHPSRPSVSCCVLCLFVWLIGFGFGLVWILCVCLFFSFSFQVCYNLFEMDSSWVADPTIAYGKCLSLLPLWIMLHLSSQTFICYSTAWWDLQSALSDFPFSPYFLGTTPKVWQGPSPLHLPRPSILSGVTHPAIYMLDSTITCYRDLQKANSSIYIWNDTRLLPKHCPNAR